MTRHATDPSQRTPPEARRRQLESRAAELRAELKTVDDEIAAAMPFGELRHDVDDDVSEGQSRERAEVRRAESERDAGELRTIEAALGRLDRGEYGRCIDCGRQIPDARLDVAPAALRCIECQTRWESRHP